MASFKINIAFHDIRVNWVVNVLEEACGLEVTIWKENSVKVF